MQSLYRFDFRIFDSHAERTIPVLLYISTCEEKVSHLIASRSTESSLHTLHVADPLGLTENRWTRFYAVQRLFPHSVFRLTWDRRLPAAVASFYTVYTKHASKPSTLGQVNVVNTVYLAYYG